MSATWGTSRLLAAGALAWAALLPLAAAVAASPRGRLGDALVIAVYGVGHAVCHQRPERSFHWGAAAWPVCARCAGIYAGAALAAAGAALWWVDRAALPAARARALVLAGALPAAASLVSEWSSGVVPSNALRAGTGVLLGGVVAFVVSALAAERRPTVEPRSMR